ncbi:MAG: class I SAM-dependent methyltransferase [Candidatus Berkelbacteria bacterium]
MHYQQIIIIFMLVVIVGVALWQLMMIVTSLFGLYLMSTNRGAIRAILSNIDIRKGQIFLDLGCGNAQNLIVASKQFGLQGIGIEIFFVQYLVAKLNVWLSGESKNIRIYLGDFRNFSELIKKADIIYLYQRQVLLEKIESELFCQAKKGSEIVCLSSYFVDHRPAKSFRVRNVYTDASVRVYKV